jgi:hypothetical protein
MSAFPNRFKLESVCDIFSSWVDETGDLSKFITKDNTDDFRIGLKTHAVYTHDKLQWVSTLEATKYTSKSGDMRCVAIRLANNGFLYPPEEMLEVADQRLQRHHAPTPWAILQGDSIATFQPLQEYALNWMQSASRDDVKMSIFYHFEEDRLDVCVQDIKQMILFKICFEPGWPTEEFRDYWK